jgi:hypothetical protein
MENCSVVVRDFPEYVGTGFIGQDFADEFRVATELRIPPIAFGHDYAR